MEKGKIYRSLFNPMRLLSIVILKLMGWKTAKIPIQSSKYILIGAPHTSNWDFVIGYMAMTAIGLKLGWVGKHTIFRKPFGWVMKWLGGIPVDRGRSRNFVEQVVKSFNNHEKLIVAIAPEGTRQKTEYWKSGFYYIAYSAGIPIVLGFVDYERKTGGFERFIIPGGEIQKDLAEISEFYKTVTAKYPKDFGPIRFRPK
jgi:1-acyl-sn-glycerol-3-phosphate acyltransferase